MSALNSGPSDDLLAELDEMLASTSDLDALADSFAHLPLDASFVANAFEFPEVPSPFEHQPAVKLEKKDKNPVRIDTGILSRKRDSPTGHEAKDTPRSTPYPKVKPQRRRRAKDELEYLRGTVADLEDKLTSLNQAAGTNALTASEDCDEEMFFRWKQVAERQKEEANKTVVENLKLRAMLKGQLAIAKRLEAAIAGYQQQVAAEAFPWNAIQAGLERHDRDKATGHSPSPSDDVIFTELNGCLEEQYRQVDSLLETSGLAKVQSEMVGKHYLKQDLQGISFRLEEVRVFPFVVQAVARNIWSFLLSNSPDWSSQMHTRVIEKDHLNATMLDTLQLPKSQHTRVFHRLAMRRHFEANRVVFVWSGYVEIDGSVFVRLREKGISVLSSYDFTDGKATTSRPKGAILRNVVDVKPETVEFGTREDSHDRIGEMTDLVLGTYHRNFGMFNQVVENLLLKDLIGPRP